MSDTGSGGFGIPVGGLIGGFAEAISNISGGKQPFDPADLPRLDTVSAQQQIDVEARIDAAIEAGGTPSQSDLTLQQALADFRLRNAIQFVENLRLVPASFQSIGIPIGQTPQQALEAFKFGLQIRDEDAARGVRPWAPGDREIVLGVIALLTAGIGAQGPINITRGEVPPQLARFIPGATGGTGARRSTAPVPAPSAQTAPAPPAPTAAAGAVSTFLNCLASAFGPGATTPRALQSILSPRFFQTILSAIFPPPQPGGQRMPFVTTPGFATTTGTFDFGGFGGIIESGLNLARNIFAPSATVQPLNQFVPQQAGLGGLIIPTLSKARSLLPAFGAGIAGSVAEGFFTNGGAATQDITAAFTDPQPGACRPKAHVKTNPCTGKGVWFVPRGRPLVFSGDLSACKRVDRVAKRLEKGRPKRRHHHHTKRRPR